MNMKNPHKYITITKQMAIAFWAAEIGPYKLSMKRNEETWKDLDSKHQLKYLNLADIAMRVLEKEDWL